MRWFIRLAIVATLVLGVLAVFWIRRADPVALLAQGERAVNQGDWMLVERFATDLDELGEPEAAALLRARMLGAQQRYPAVITVLNTIDPRSPFFPEAARLLGLAFFALEQPQPAEHYLQLALEANPDHADTHRVLGIIAYDQGRLGEAITHLEVVAAQDMQDGKPLRLIGLIHKDMDQPVEAIKAYRNALARDLPPIMRQEALLELGELYLKQQQIDDLSEAIAAITDHTSAGYAVLKAEWISATQPAEQAAKTISEYLIAHPDQPDLLRLRAKAHRSLDENDRAIALLQRAEKLSPADYRIPYELVQIYDALGQKEQAAAAKKRVDAIQADLTAMTKRSFEAMEKPRDPQVRRELAAIARRLGKTELAERWLRAADEVEGLQR